MADISEVLQRTLMDLLARPTGPEAFRFYLQPAMATITAVRDGVKDARTGRSPYFWTVLANPNERRGRLNEGFTSTARILLLGLGMEAIYQARVLGTFYPGQAIIIILLLAFVPYLLLRGPVDRIARWWRGRAASGATRPPKE
jgi:hypothetical protein